MEFSYTPTLSELREELERANTEVRILREQAGALKAAAKEALSLLDNPYREGNADSKRIRENLRAALEAA